MKNVFFGFVITVLVILFIPLKVLSSEDQSFNIHNEALLITCDSIVVDSDENLYLANSFLSQVQVYDRNGVFSHAIRISTSGAFMLGINDEDHLYVAIARQDKVIVFDKEGYILREILDDNGRYWSEYEARHGEFKALDGSVYSIVKFMGYITVSHSNNDVNTRVYNMPIFGWIIKVILFTIFGAGSFIAFIVVWGYSYGKKNKNLRKNKNFRFKYYYSWIKKGMKNSSFNDLFYEINCKRKEFFRKIITYGFLLIAITINTLYISSIGYQNIGFEFLAGYIVIFLYYIIIDILLLVFRFLSGSFVERRSINLCNECRGEKPNFWIFTTEIRGTKYMCPFCKKTFEISKRTNQVGEILIASLIAVCVLLLIMLFLTHQGFVYRLGIAIIWSIGIWYLSIFFIKSILYNKTKFNLTK